MVLEIEDSRTPDHIFDKIVADHVNILSKSLPASKANDRYIQAFT